MRLLTITGRGHRLITTIYPIPFAGTLLKEFITTGMIISGVTTTMGIGAATGISARIGVEWIGKLMAGADRLTTPLPEPATATGADLFTMHRPDPFITHRPDPFITHRPDPFTMHRPDPFTMHRTNPFTMHRPDLITATGADRSTTTTRRDQTKGAGTGPFTAHRADLAILP